MRISTTPTEIFREYSLRPNDAVPLLKPSAGYDPLGAQAGGAQRLQAKVLVFGFGAEEFSVKW